MYRCRGELLLQAEGMHSGVCWPPVASGHGSSAEAEAAFQPALATADASKRNRSSCVEARPTSLIAARYREPPWRPLIETAGAVLAGGRERGEAVEQVVATIWAAIVQAQVDTASDASAQAR